MKIDWQELAKGVRAELEKHAAPAVKPTLMGKVMQGAGKVVNNPLFHLGSMGLMAAPMFMGGGAQEQPNFMNYMPPQQFKDNTPLNPNQPLKVVVHRPGVNLLDVPAGEVHSLSNPTNFHG